MYVRDVYLRDGWVVIRPQDVVVDLGANMGNFSALALASHPTVRVIAVEPSIDMNDRFVKSLGLNDGFLDRTELIRGFMGRPSAKISEVLKSDPNYADAAWISETEFIQRTGIDHIDVLKCDIEGGEFGLLGRDSRILAMTAALACEVHSFGGDVGAFLAGIEASGFDLGPMQRDSDGTVTFVAKRTRESGGERSCAA
jgi:FkbM family methyltransferase